MERLERIFTAGQVILVKASSVGRRESTFVSIMTESIHSRILILQGDPIFGHKMAQELHKDRQSILGPVSDVSSVYKLLISELPNFAVIDASINKAEVERISLWTRIKWIGAASVVQNDSKVCRECFDGNT